MVRSEIFTQARQGNPQAIAALMNHSLQPRQIQVSVSVKDRELVAIATGQTPPDRDFMVNFVQRGMSKLEAEPIRYVTVVGYVWGGTAPLWHETVALAPSSETPVEPSSERPVGSVSSAPRPGVSTSQTFPTTLNGNPRSAIASPPAPPATPPSRPKLPPVGRSRRRRPVPPWLARLRTFGGILLFLAISALSIALAAVVKLFATLLAENSIYSIQFLGDLLRGIDIAEVFNILVFAILGLGLGVATAFVHRNWGIRFNAAIAIVLLPLLLSVGPFIRYDNWVNEFASNESISRLESKRYTDRYLQRRIDRTGPLGFYLHTAKYPGLPVYIAQLDEVDALESEAVNRVQRTVGITSRDLSRWFAICMWGIRGFYFLVSAITLIAHFGQGVMLGDRIAQRNLEDWEHAGNAAAES